MFKIKLGATRFSVGLSLVLAACAGAVDDPEQPPVSLGELEQALSTPALPSPTLAVPDGNELAFYFAASGVQIYACQALTPAAGYGWVFQAPEATLYGRRGRVMGKHYAGPTWESLDHSTVVASKLAAFTADPSAIPELLLQATAHSGTGSFSDVTFIQRLDTTGGLAPAAGCAAEQVGAVARVDYTATYYFYEAARRCAGAGHR